MRTNSSPSEPTNSGKSENANQTIDQRADHRRGLTRGGVIEAADKAVKSLIVQALVGGSLAVTQIKGTSK